MSARPPIENAATLADIWDRWSLDTPWSKLARRLGALGGKARYWCGMPRCASAIPLTFELFLPNGDPFPCDSRLRDIRNAIRFLESGKDRTP